MGSFDIWADLNFRANPYNEQTLHADFDGKFLLVGREDLIGRIARRIGTPGSHPTVEGPVGVGKSSPLNVAAYTMMEQLVASKERRLFVPCVQAFQPMSNLDDFEATVYEAVAQTLIEYQDTFPHVGLEKLDVGNLHEWLNAPHSNSRSGELNVFGTGVAYGRDKQPNTGEGFRHSGFKQAVQSALRYCFPEGTGGVICILDNLELLETATEARQVLEQLRDQVFNVQGLRWVLCGARGMVSRARSQRLSGIFKAPLVIPPVKRDLAPEVVRRRMQTYGGVGAMAPVTPTGFARLYELLNYNMRDALSAAQEFSQWLHERQNFGYTPYPSEGRREQLLEEWMQTRAEEAHRDAGNVQARVWRLFDDMCQADGQARSADYKQLDFNEQAQMAACVTRLVDANLVVREADPENGQRTINLVTSMRFSHQHFDR